jgi:hypothetical protein
MVELDEEELKGQNFPVLLDKYGVLAGGGKGAGENFLGGAFFAV